MSDASPFARSQCPPPRLANLSVGAYCLDISSSPGGMAFGRNCPGIPDGSKRSRRAQKNRVRVARSAFGHYVREAGITGKYLSVIGAPMCVLAARFHQICDRYKSMCRAAVRHPDPIASGARLPVTPPIRGNRGWRSWLTDLLRALCILHAFLMKASLDARPRPTVAHNSTRLADAVRTLSRRQEWETT